MLTLKLALARHGERQTAPLGGVRTSPTLDRKVLREDLIAVRNSTRLLCFVCAGMVVALFVAAAMVIVAHPERPRSTGSISAAFGVSSAGLIAWMAKLARDNARTGMLLALVEHIDEATLRTTVTVLLKELRP